MSPVDQTGVVPSVKVQRLREERSEGDKRVKLVRLSVRSKYVALV